MDSLELEIALVLNMLSIIAASIKKVFFMIISIKCNKSKGKQKI